MTYPAQQLRTAPPPRLTPDQLARREAEAFPEALGPGQDHESGLVTFGGQQPHPRVGPVPVQAGAGVQDREREAAERQAREAAVPPEVRAARELIEAEMRAGRRRF